MISSPQVLRLALLAFFSRCICRTLRFLTKHSTADRSRASACRDLPAAATIKFIYFRRAQFIDEDQKSGRVGEPLPTLTRLRSLCASWRSPCEFHAPRRCRRSSNRRATLAHGRMAQNSGAKKSKIVRVDHGRTGAGAPARTTHGGRTPRALSARGAHRGEADPASGRARSAFGASVRANVMASQNK